MGVILSVFRDILGVILNICKNVSGCMLTITLDAVVSSEKERVLLSICRALWQVQPIPPAPIFSNAVSQLKDQSSNVSFATFL